VTNFIGNGVAGLAIARWEKELDMDRLRSELSLSGPRQEAGKLEVGQLSE
jgi:hypothetical protein